VIIADTKFEFGHLPDGRLILIDEVFDAGFVAFSGRPTSTSRGGTSPSYDKQFVRNYLETLKWDKTPPGPVLPDEVVGNTRKKYLEAYERLTGKKLAV